MRTLFYTDNGMKAIYRIYLDIFGMVQHKFVHILVITELTYFSTAQSILCLQINRNVWDMK